MASSTDRDTVTGALVVHHAPPAGTAAAAKWKPAGKMWPELLVEVQGPGKLGTAAKMEAAFDVWSVQVPSSYLIKDCICIVHLE